MDKTETAKELKTRKEILEMSDCINITGCYEYWEYRELLSIIDFAQAQWQDELNDLIENIEQVKSFIKLEIPNVQDKYIIVNCFSGMIRRQQVLKEALKILGTNGGDD